VVQTMTKAKCLLMLQKVGSNFGGGKGSRKRNFQKL